MTTRRSFFAAISTALSWRPGKSNIGLMEFRTQDSLFKQNPLIVRVALPRKFLLTHKRIRCLNAIQQTVSLMSYLQEAPDIIAVGRNSWHWIVESLHPLSRNWVNPDSEFHRSGFRTMACFGAEMILDPSLPDDDMWIISSKFPNHFTRNTRLVFLGEGASVAFD